MTDSLAVGREIAEGAAVWTWTSLFTARRLNLSCEDPVSPGTDSEALYYEVSRMAFQLKAIRLLFGKFLHLKNP